VWNCIGWQRLVCLELKMTLKEHLLQIQTDIRILKQNRTFDMNTCKLDNDSGPNQGRRADIVKRARSEMVKQNQVKILDLAASWLEEELQEIGLEI